MFTQITNAFSMDPSHLQTRPLGASIRAIAGHPLWAPLNDAEAWTRALNLIRPTRSLVEPSARVVRVDSETDKVISLWLRPNRRFRGFAAGQHLMLTLEVDGVLQSRCFSLSRQPRADGLLRLTIAIKPGGVSAATAQLEPGQIVRISQALGDFAPTTTKPLLLISAGSGVTPMLSMLHGLAQTNGADVCLVHCGSTAEQTVAAGELRQLAQQWPGMRLHLHFSADSGRLDGEQLTRYVPDWDQREALLCGPAGFMETVERHYRQANRLDQLSYESFGDIVEQVGTQATEHAVSYGKPAQAFTVTTGQSLLLAAENAGLTPRFGCRRGICRSCVCQKHSGRVRNLVTQQVSGPGQELIALCVSTPITAVELDGQPQRIAS